MRRNCSLLKGVFGRGIAWNSWSITMCGLLLCIFPGVKLQAQATLLADSNHVETGNPYVLYLRFPAHLGKPDSMNFDAWESVLPRKNILKQSVWQLDGQYRNKQLTALFFDEDSIQLPPLPIRFANGDTIYTNALQILVTATPAADDLNDMQPIKDIHREPTLWTDYWPWMLGVLVLLGIVGLFYWWSNHKPKVKIHSRTIQIPAHELAARKLEVLEKKQLAFYGFVKEHYTELTFILREYLEKRFAIPALESTTDETLGYLKKLALETPLPEQIKALLEQADLAKFAKIIPPEDFHSSSMELSRKIIRQTSVLDNPDSTDNRPITP